ncbi:MAG: helix-turn-helix transcriptional regulator [Eubacterium sp.]|nr:helix-turn-helix transcriptional regulator [Eubacterium sp.]
MNAVLLGKRIKEARLQRKMTQSELVGDFITRNMLSRIESGNACPSVKTLEYLAQRLDIPFGQLMDDDIGDIETAVPDGADMLIEAKRLYLAEEYITCETLAKDLEESAFADEAAALIARCGIADAKRQEAAGNHRAAAEAAEKALKYANIGVYASREIKTEAVLLLDRAAEKI